jgi:hypothetical protein
MTISQNTAPIFRWSIVLLLAVAWLCILLQWSAHRNGALEVEELLLGTALLGLTTWLIPVSSRPLRISVRLVGSLVALVAAGALGFVGLLLTQL